MSGAPKVIETIGIAIEYTHNGKVLTVDAWMDPAEYDVGIMRPYATEIWCQDENGERVNLPPELQNDDRLLDRLAEAAEDIYEGPDE